MAIGYACMVIGEADTAQRSCVLKYADEERIRAISLSNLAALERMIEYNIHQGICLFRISSEIIPFGSHPINTLEWKGEFKEQFFRIGEKIKQGGIRVSMHPGQYVVLNSPNQSVVQSAIADLQYHSNFLDALGTEKECKLVLHIGGVYGDKKSAMQTFVQNFQTLPRSIQDRLVIENDDKHYTVSDVLTVSELIGVPVVFDSLHHITNPPIEQKNMAEWVELCGKTWREADGRQKIHYSQAKAGGKLGAHSQTIAVGQFLGFYREVSGEKLDIMLEVKDKNLSAVKCIHSVADRLPIKVIEQQWARYKYFVLSRSARHYNQIRALLKDKAGASTVKLYSIIEEAAALPLDRGAQLNAALHVWGYLKKDCTPSEKKRFDKLIGEYHTSGKSEQSIKNHLLKCAITQDVEYLKQSYYFYI